MEYRLTEKTSLMAVAVGQYGDARALPALMWANGYELPTDGVPGAVVDLPAWPGLNEPAPAAMPVRVQQEFYSRSAAEGQTLVDMAIQEYGSVEGLVQLLWDNAAMLPATSLAVGAVLQVRSVLPDALPVFEASYYRNTGQRVNLHLVAAAEGGYWLTEDGRPWETEDGQYWEL